MAWDDNRWLCENVRVVGFFCGLGSVRPFDELRTGGRMIVYCLLII